MTTSKSIERYLHDVGKALPCVRKTRRTLTEGLRQELAEFAENTPETSYETLCEVFSDPKAAAEQLLEGLDQSELRRVRYRKRALLAMAVCVVAGVVVFLFSELYNAHQTISNGGFTLVVEDVRLTGSDENHE